MQKLTRVRISGKYVRKQWRYNVHDLFLIQHERILKHPNYTHNKPLEAYDKKKLKGKKKKKKYNNVYMVYIFFYLIKLLQHWYNTSYLFCFYSSTAL